MAKQVMEINLKLDVYDAVDDLGEEDGKLMQLAREVAVEAYAPYSNFNVGAALLLANGEIIKGSNQENIAYNSGICAERVALFAAGANYPGVPVVAMAVTATSATVNLDSPLSPCGACRQVMAEYEKLGGDPFRIIMSGETGKVWVAHDVATILPLIFHSDAVKKHY